MTDAEYMRKSNDLFAKIKEERTAQTTPTDQGEKKPEGQGSTQTEASPPASPLQEPDEPEKPKTPEEQAKADLDWLRGEEGGMGQIVDETIEKMNPSSEGRA